MDYHLFTDTLIHKLESDPQVIGVVLLGSTASQKRKPDQYSDHDFFVIVHMGVQQRFRDMVTWLPYPDRIVFHYQETEHGCKVIYDDAHLLEFAIFSPQELLMARANAYKVVVDKANITPLMDQVAQHSERPRKPDHYYWGQFLGHVLVGCQRYWRGERLSGHQFIKDYALRDVLAMVHKHIERQAGAGLDNLDRFRRVEQAFPEITKALDDLLLLPPPDAAQTMIALMETHFSHLDSYPQQAMQTIKDYLGNHG